MIRPADFLCIISFIMRKGAAAFFPLHLNVKIWVSTSHKQDRMSDTTGTIADITQEATRIIDAANAAGIPLRLLGGLAIYFQCPGAGSVERLQRKYNDLDFATLSKWGTKTRALFAKLGYTGNKTFNALHGHQRLFFWDEQHGRQIDIFIDRMQMCHIIDFRSRLQLDQRIDADYIARLAANDWGLQKTLEINLKKTRAFAIEHDFPAHVPEGIEALLAAMEARPKSLAWKARAIVGERVRWYELP